VDRVTSGTVIKISKQWWLKINTKPVRMHALDGAIFPHIIKVQYVVDGRIYCKRKWIRAGCPVPPIGKAVEVRYREDRPQWAKVL